MDTNVYEVSWLVEMEGYPPVDGKPYMAYESGVVRARDEQEACRLLNRPGARCQMLVEGEPAAPKGQPRKRYVRRRRKFPKGYTADRVLGELEERARNTLSPGGRALAIRVEESRGRL